MLIYLLIFRVSKFSEGLSFQVFLQMSPLQVNASLIEVSSQLKTLAFELLCQNGLLKHFISITGTCAQNLEAIRVGIMIDFSVHM